jgi:hypothetical protein
VQHQSCKRLLEQEDAPASWIADDGKSGDPLPDRRDNGLKDIRVSANDWHVMGERRGGNDAIGHIRHLCSANLLHRLSYVTIDRYLDQYALKLIRQSNQA